MQDLYDGCNLLQPTHYADTKVAIVNQLLLSLGQYLKKKIKFINLTLIFLWYFMRNYAINLLIQFAQGIHNAWLKLVFFFFFADQLIYAIFLCETKKHCFPQ